MWPEGIERGTHDAFQRSNIGTMSTPGWKRQVDVGASTVTFSHFLDGAGVGRIESVLMERDRQHGRVGIKDILRTVTVMDIPIDDRNTIDFPLFIPSTCRYGDVRKDREASTATGIGMVTARSYQRISVVHSLLQYGLDRLQATGGSEGCNVKAIWPKLRVWLARMPAPRPAQISNARNVCPGVDPQ